MRSVQDTFEARMRSFISAFSIYMTVQYEVVLRNIIESQI